MKEAIRQSLKQFGQVSLGPLCFLAYLFSISIWNLISNTGGMENKFSDLARDRYAWFMLQQNIMVLLAYGILWLIATLLIYPWVMELTMRSRWRQGWVICLRAWLLTWLIHEFFTLRLVVSKPYFITKEMWLSFHFRWIQALPEWFRLNYLPWFFSGILTIFIAITLFWYVRTYWVLGSKNARILWAAVLLTFGIAIFSITRSFSNEKTSLVTKPAKPRFNFLIIGSDSLRGDRLGCSGYKPARKDGLASAGVSPAIDAFAQEAVRFETCYTSIASTLESGTSLMTSQYPHTHGIRQMFPNRETVQRAQKNSVPAATILRSLGYETAAIGDWCASYYQVMPLGFEHIQVSNFDHFKNYMMQTVMMSHFVMPLYFDHMLGRAIFPALGSFAQSVTPEVVTDKVKHQLAKVAASERPFFWHVFYSCNHLKYRSPEPYCSMFRDPQYQGQHRTELNLNMDAFISKTNVEDKITALAPEDIRQIHALYDGCTRHFDDQVKIILEELKKHDLERNTVVIITSDHGDDLYEPGVTFGHGLTFNGGLRANHVPMIIKVPGIEPRVIPEAVRLIDVMPTVLDFIGEKTPSSWEGVSFAPWIQQKSAPEWRPFYGETGFPFIQFKVPNIERKKLPAMDELTFIDESFNYQFVLKQAYEKPLIDAKQRCLRTKRWKLVYTLTSQGIKHYELFDLIRDPDAVNDLAASRKDVLAAMVSALERWMIQHEESSIQTIFPNGEPE